MQKTVSNRGSNPLPLLHRHLPEVIHQEISEQFSVYFVVLFHVGGIESY